MKLLPTKNRPSTLNTVRNNCMYDWVIPFIMVISMTMVSSTTTTTSTTTGIQFPMFVIGLPRSGSLSIHNYVTCHWNTLSTASSAHYCCNPQRQPIKNNNIRTSFPCHDISIPNSTTTTTTAGSSSSSTSSTIVPCGECLLNSIQAFSKVYSSSKQSTKSFLQEKAQQIFHTCGNYTIWSNYDVETSFSSSSEEDENWLLPQAFALPIIHKAFPQATFIYNKRSTSTQWAQSIFHWNTKTNRMLNAFSFNTTNNNKLVVDHSTKRTTQQQLLNDMQYNLDTKINNITYYQERIRQLQQIYDRHEKYVYEFVRRYQSHSLITMNMDDGYGYNYDPTKDNHSQQQETISTLLDTIIQKIWKMEQVDDTQIKKNCMFEFNAKEIDEDYKEFSLQKQLSLQIVETE